jgi:hypothetical protein
MCPLVASIATPKRKMPSGSGTVVLGGRTRRGSGPQWEIGKIPSNGMQKRARLNGSTGIGRAFFVRLSPLEDGMSIADAKAIDIFGKGGGMVDGKLVREFPPSIR